NVPAVIALCFPAVAGLVFCAAFRGPVTRRLLTNRWITTIGGMCYSIYLIHYPLMLWLSRELRPLLGSSFGLNVVILTVVLGAAVVAAGTIFFALIERPCMEPDWPSRLLRSARASWARARRSTQVQPPRGALIPAEARSQPPTSRGDVTR